MRHYGLGQWSDYVRGEAGDDEAELSRHLEAGCESCQRVVTSLREVASGASGERPPISAPASAETIKGIALYKEPVERQVMDLVWDSARAPWLLGEGSHDPGRQLHYANSEFVLNARVEGGAGTNASTLSGRLQSLFQVGVHDLEVRLVSERAVLDSGATGTLGEFELPLSEADPVELQIALTDARELIVTLGEE